MKKIILLWILIFIPIVYGLNPNLEECGRFIFQEDVPCLVISSYTPLDGCSKNFTIYFQNSTELLNGTWQNYYPVCAFEFNYTTPLVYLYSSDLEDGVITVQREDNMLALTILQLGLILFFVVLGMPFKFGFAKFTAWSLAVLQIMITIWISYISHTGGDFTMILLINYLAIFIIGGILSFMAILMLMVKMSTGEGKNLSDDGYTKFINDTR